MFLSFNLLSVHYLSKRPKANESDQHFSTRAHVCSLSISRIFQGDLRWKKKHKWGKRCRMRLRSELVEWEKWGYKGMKQGWKEAMGGRKWFAQVFSDHHSPVISQRAFY